MTSETEPIRQLAGVGATGERQTYENDADTVHIDLIARDSTEADTDGTNDGQNGALRIVANKTGNEITSARIKSDIGEIGSHGYYEVRAKIPAESGAWPAIWLLGTWITVPGRMSARSTSWSGLPPCPTPPTRYRAPCISGAPPTSSHPTAVHNFTSIHDTLELCRGLAYLPGLVVTGRDPGRGRRERRERPSGLYKAARRDQ